MSPDFVLCEYRNCQAAPSSEAKGPPPTLLPSIPTPHLPQVLHDRTAGSTNSAGKEQRIWERALGLRDVIGAVTHSFGVLGSVALHWGW